MTSTPAPAPEPTTQERLTWMRKNSKRLIIALILILVAAAVVTFSFSLFTSSSANPGNMVASGTMEINNSADGEAILTVTGLLPGESGDGTVTITNVGDAEGQFSMTTENLVDTPVDPAFSGVLNLLITEDGAPVYDGALAEVGTLDLGVWASNDTHTYTFKVTFDSAAGNEYQGAETTLDFIWDAAQVSG